MAKTKAAGAQKSARPRMKRKQGGRGKPFKPGNPWRIKPGEVRNPGGRPRLLSESYREWLAYQDADGVTNADKVAVKVGESAFKGNMNAAKELRQATEGDRLTFDLNQLTNEQLQRIANGEDPRVVLAASGAGGSAAPSTDGADSSCEGCAPAAA